MKEKAVEASTAYTHSLFPYVPGPPAPSSSQPIYITVKLMEHAGLDCHTGRTDVFDSKLLQHTKFCSQLLPFGQCCL